LRGFRSGAFVFPEGPQVVQDAAFVLVLCETVDGGEIEAIAALLALRALPVAPRREGRPPDGANVRDPRRAAPSGEQVVGAQLVQDGGVLCFEALPGFPGEFFLESGKLAA
jgi:hypothetical protein